MTVVNVTSNHIEIIVNNIGLTNKNIGDKVSMINRSNEITIE